jgi:predicted nucleic acid-binding protein
VKKILKSKAVYLDVCSLCRPFDDQHFLRIRMESEAIHLILESIRAGAKKMIVSPVHFREIEATSDTAERVKLFYLLNSYGETVKVDMAEARHKADQLFRAGFGAADAAYVSFAEAAVADFVTCDDRLLKRCLKSNIKIWCGDPLQYCLKEDIK